MLSAVPAVREARRASAAVSGDDEAVEADDPCGDDRAFVLLAFYSLPAPARLSSAIALITNGCPDF